MELLINEKVVSKYEIGMCISFNSSEYGMGIISDIFAKVENDNEVVINYEVIDANNTSIIVKEKEILYAITKEQLDFFGITSETVYDNYLEIEAVN